MSVYASVCYVLQDSYRSLITTAPLPITVYTSVRLVNKTSRIEATWIIMGGFEMLGIGLHCLYIHGNPINLLWSLRVYRSHRSLVRNRDLQPAQQLTSPIGGDQGLRERGAVQYSLNKARAACGLDQAQTRWPVFISSS